ncbi:hypothetical protein CDL15_Pgr014895 [Punica granatum]|uniref:Uncharacterized protein n=1 Tax=Punica granatum TaxID=22663 RepID=A0A218Y228_PUNGR|nr:hypothetical protein CDL15_Pgr014895 [Punica granatum]
MSNGSEQTPAEEPRVSDQNPTGPTDQAQEWEAMARAWLRAFPEAKAVSVTDVEAWIDVNRSCLPAELKSMAKSELIERLLSIQNILRLPTQAPPEKEVSQKEYPYRFQRTDQWLPVYSWLESLETDDVVKSNEIADWLTNNPEIRDQLSAKHSKYHLTHYIKKCHMKILKRKEKKKVVEHPAEVPLVNAGRSLPSKHLVPIPYNPVSNIPKDSELYVAKRNEAVRNLVAFEKQLLTLFPRN